MSLVDVTADYLVCNVLTKSSPAMLDHLDDALHHHLRSVHIALYFEIIIVVKAGHSNK